MTYISLTTRERHFQTVCQDYIGPALLGLRHVDGENGRVHVTSGVVMGQPLHGGDTL